MPLITVRKWQFLEQKAKISVWFQPACLGSLDQASYDKGFDRILRQRDRLIGKVKLQNKDNCLTLMRELNITSDKVNVNGGACAMGHPIGATGARIIVTLLHALQKRGRKRGIAGLCIGGGEATALAIEKL
jgi:hypothetical protein